MREVGTFASVARMRSIALLALLALAGCKSSKGAPSATLEGTVAGVPLHIVSALSAATTAGDLVVALSDVPLECPDIMGARQPPKANTIFLYASEVVRTGPGGQRLPQRAETLRMVNFADYRALWFPADAKEIEGRKRLSPGAYVAWRSNVPTEEALKQEEPNWPNGQSGSLTLNSVPSAAGDMFDGDFEATLESHEFVRGEFHALYCGVHP